MVAEKIIFLQMHNTILQSEKYFLNVQMKNLKKKKLESPPPPPPRLLRRPAPALCLHPLFLIFHILPHTSGEVIKIYFPSFKRGEGGDLNYVVPRVIKCD